MENKKPNTCMREKRGIVVISENLDSTDRVPKREKIVSRRMK